MRLPRWTVYPALAVLGVMLLPAVPGKAGEAEPLAAPRASRSAPAVVPAKRPRVVVLGVDGMDPEILAEVLERYPERMTNFQWLVDQGGIHTLGTSTPPQSPVAWSNFITGMDPGGHGIFDFIHRDLVHRGPASSTTRTDSPSDSIGLWGEWQIPTGGATSSNRTGKAFWTVLMEAGVPADVWRMPINFPVEPAEGLSFPGMLTPALDSAYGQCTLYTTDPQRQVDLDYEKVVPVSEFGGRIDTRLSGPPNPFKHGDPSETVPLVVYVDREAGACAVEVDGQVLVLEVGEWSEFVPVNFSLAPMGLQDMSGICRFYLRSLEPELELYASPVNIDPTNPATPVSEPSDASADLAEEIGLYYTQGMAEDVNSLKNEVLDDAEFMGQVGLVYDERREMLDTALARYAASPEGGLLFFYFSTVDLSCHMMWRHSDPEHPFHDPTLAAEDSSDWSERPGSTWKDVVQDLYMKMDPALGRIREVLGDDVRLIVMSDHGFTTYDRKFSLNTWLHQEGYLVLHEGYDKELEEGAPGFQTVAINLPGVVDWSRTRAYGMGFNGLYLNLAGREQDDPKTDADESGIVQPGAEAEALLAELKTKLEAIRDPKDGEQVVLRADLATDVYVGPRVPEAPDILVGYNDGYCNSDEASSGRIPAHVLSDNLGGTFNGSHLMAPEVVNGILLTNQTVRGGEHRLQDVTVELLSQFGVDPTPGMSGHRVLEAR